MRKVSSSASGHAHTFADGDGKARDSFRMTARVFVFAVDGGGERFDRADEKLAVFLRRFGELGDMFFQIVAHDIKSDRRAFRFL